MKILVAGAGGFVGGAVIGRLRGQALVLPSRFPDKFRNSGIDGEFPLFTEDLERLVREHKPEAVVNLLGIIRESGTETFEKVHLEYTRRLLAGARAAGVKRFVQMSALGAAAGSPSRYQASKAAAEAEVSASGLDWVIFRPSLITGPGQKLFSDLRRLARFAPLLAAPSDSLAAPVRLDDVAECFRRAALGELASGIYELAGEEEMDFAELARRGLAAAGVRRPVLGLPRAFFLPLLPFMALLPEPPLTLEQYRMLGNPNVPSGRYPGVAEILGSVRPAF